MANQETHIEEVVVPHNAPISDQEKEGILEEFNNGIPEVLDPYSYDQGGDGTEDFFLPRSHPEMEQDD